MSDKFGYKKQLEGHRSYYKSGETRSIEFRILMLKKLYRAIIRNEDKIAKALQADLGKSMQEVVTTEIGQITGEIKFLVKEIRKHSAKKRVRTNWLNMPSKSFIIREPYGVTLVMGPWNYPFQLVMSPLAAAIAAGNCVVVKPSELASHTAEVIDEIIRETFSSDYVSVVQGGIEETTELLEQRFDKIFFTGSPKVGSIVMEKAAKHLTPVILELGGKSPCVVDKTAKLEMSVRRILFGKGTNAGQTCVAPDYILLDDAIAEEFYETFERIASEFYGDEYEDNPDFCRIINERNFDRLLTFLEDGKIVYGGKSNRDKLNIDMTLIEVNDLDLPIMTEEIFGPILPVVRYKEIGQAIEIIDRNPNPLSMYIFSRNNKLINRLLHEVAFGGGCINDTLLHLTNEHLPFGGRGTSGMGHYHGKYSLMAFTHEKSVLKGQMFFDIMIKYPPFNKKSLAFLKKMLY